MDKIKELYTKHRNAIAVALVVLAAIAGATANLTDDKVVAKIEQGVEIADKYLLEEVNVPSVD